jgi:isomerase DpgB
MALTDTSVTELTITATALSADLVARVGELCDRVEDAGCDAVLLRLAGDPDAVRPAAVTVGLVSQWERALRRLERSPVPLVATVHGTCAGPAVDALLVADYRVAAVDAELRLRDRGTVWPGMALHRLVQQVGVARARRLVFGAARVGARDAEAWGLVDKVVEPHVVVGAAESAAGELSRMGGGDVAILRRLLLDSAAASFEDALGVHLAACDRVLRRSTAKPDARAGASR